MNFLKQQQKIFLGIELFLVIYVTTAATVAVLSSSPNSVRINVSQPEKRDTSKQEQLQQQPSTEEIADDIFTDETKKKRSQEVIMFGNQQNKPAGMVDDGLVHFSEKKAQKRQNNDGGNAAEDQNDDEQEVQDQYAGNREILPVAIQQMSNSQEKVPIISEVGQVNDDDQENFDTNGKQQEISELNELDTRYLSRGLIPGDAQLDELDDSPSQNFEAEPSYASTDWNEYTTGNQFFDNNDETFQRRRRNAAATADRMHFRRPIKKQNLLTPLDQLMYARRGTGSARWKRDLKLSKDDVVGLLGILAAAEAAKERQQSRQHGLTELESAYLDSLSETRPAESEDNDDVDGLNRYLGTLTRYDSPAEDDNQDNDLELREIPDWSFAESEPSLQLRRRSKPFYPPVDYRSLGVLGTKKRSMSHYYPGMWGRFESKQKRSGIFRKGSSLDFGQFRPRFRNFDEDDSELSKRGRTVDDLDADEFDRAGGVDEASLDDLGGRNLRDEQLYTLGELLNGNDVDDVQADQDHAYPVYKRLI